MDDELAADALESTRRALCDRGFADLTVRNVANGAEWSNSLRHYDSKANPSGGPLASLSDRFATGLASSAALGRERSPGRPLDAVAHDGETRLVADGLPEVAY